MTFTERAKRQAERRASDRLWWLAWLWLAVKWMLRTAVQHLAVTGLVAVVLLTWWAVDRGWWPWLAATTGVTCLALGGWCEARPDGWARLAGRIVARYRLRAYRRLWEDAMDGAGLIRAGYSPGLESLRLGGGPADRDLDVLRVAMAPGQLVSDWRTASPRLVSALGSLGIRRLRCHPVTGRPDLVELFAGRRSPVQRAAFTPPRDRRNNGVTKPAEDGDSEQAETGEDVQGQQAGGAFPRIPGGAR